MLHALLINNLNDTPRAPRIAYDDEVVSTALGYVGHFIFMLSKYMGVPLRYPSIPVHHALSFVIMFKAIPSNLIDRFVPSRRVCSSLFCTTYRFPLFCKSAGQPPFEAACMLLNKNIEHVTRLLCSTHVCITSHSMCVCVSLVIECTSRKLAENLHREHSILSRIYCYYSMLNARANSERVPMLRHSLPTPTTTITLSHKCHVSLALLVLSSCIMHLTATARHGLLSLLGPVVAQDFLKNRSIADAAQIRIHAHMPARGCTYTRVGQSADHESSRIRSDRP